MRTPCLTCLWSLVFVFSACCIAVAGPSDYSGEITPITDPIKVEYKPYSGSFVTDNKFKVNGKSQGQAMQYDVNITRKGDVLLYAIKVPTTDPKQKKQIAYTDFLMEIKPNGEIVDLHMNLYDPKGKKIDIPESRQMEAAVKKMADSMCFHFPADSVKDGDVLYSSSLKSVIESLNLGEIEEPENGMEMVVVGKTMVGNRECVIAKLPKDTKISMDTKDFTLTMVCNGYTLFDIEAGYFNNSGVVMDMKLRDKKQKQTVNLEMTSVSTLQ